MMNTNIQLLRNYTTATAAGLRRVGRVDYHDAASGLGSLVCEQFAEHSQAHVVSGAGEAAVLKHEVKAQILQHNRAVGVCQLARHLVPAVAPLIGNMLLLLCQLLNRLATALTAFLAPGNLPLQSMELGERLQQVFWAVKRRAITKRQGVRDTHVYANGQASVLPRLRFRQLNLQAYVPPGWFTHDDDVFELAIWKRAVPANGYQSSVLHVQFTAFDTGTVARLVIDAIKARRFLEARVSTLTLKKLAKRAIETAQHLLPGRHIQHSQRVLIRFFIAPVAPHPCLFVVRNAVTRFSPPLAAKVQSRIVQPATGLKDVAQGLFLLVGRVKAVFVRAEHLNVPFAPECIA